MSDDFLTQERIRKLQVMGITVWQERGKRVPPVEADSRNEHQPDRRSAESFSQAPTKVSPRATGAIQYSRTGCR